MKKLPPPDEYILQQFEKGLRKWGEKSDAQYENQASQEWNVFRISQIGHCQAAITYDWLGHETPEQDLQSLLRLHDGAWTHREVRELFNLSDIKLIHEERELGKSYVVELENRSVTVPLKLLGHQDNSFLYGKKEVVVDFKKASERSFDKMDSEGELSDAYWDQMQGYLDITKSELGILFVKGVHGKVNAFLIERDERYFTKEVLPRLAKTALFRKKNAVGNRDFHQGSWVCQYCPHSTRCWGVDAPLEDRGTLVKPEDARFGDVKTAFELKRKADEAADLADQLKSDARSVATSLFKKLRTKKITSQLGGITWTSFTRKSIRLRDEKKRQAVERGYAEESESKVEYALFSPAKGK